ncbi:hypothetical protein RTBOTA2_002298, partial [Rhodotorula toruloides]
RRGERADPADRFPPRPGLSALLQELLSRLRNPAFHPDPADGPDVLLALVTLAVSPCARKTLSALDIRIVLVHRVLSVPASRARSVKQDRRRLSGHASPRRRAVDDLDHVLPVLRVRVLPGRVERQSRLSRLNVVSGASRWHYRGGRAKGRAQAAAAARFSPLNNFARVKPLKSRQTGV